MVISVCHLTDQVEIGGGGHAPILTGVRGPTSPPSAGPRAPYPSANPTPSPASDSYTSVLPGGYDDPFLCHVPCAVAGRGTARYHRLLPLSPATLSEVTRLAAYAI